jgi:hypothetical protein
MLLPSDARLKKDFELIYSPLEMVERLEGLKNAEERR